MKSDVIQFPQWVFLVLFVLLPMSGAKQNCTDLVCKSKPSCDLKQCFIPDNPIVNVTNATVYKRTKECDRWDGWNFAYLDNYIWTRGSCALKATVCYTFDPRPISTNVTAFNNKADEWNEADDAANIMKMSIMMMEKARPGDCWEKAGPVQNYPEEFCTDLVCKSKPSCYLKQCPVSTRYDATIINATVYKRTKECDYTLRRNFAYLDNHIWTRGCCALEAKVCYTFVSKPEWPDVGGYTTVADEWNETYDAADITKMSTMMMVKANPKTDPVYIDEDGYKKTNVAVLQVALPVGICLILFALLGFVFRMKIKGLVSQFREPSYNRHGLSNPVYEINGPTSGNTASDTFDNVQSGNKPAGGYEYVKPLPRKKLGGQTKEHPSKVAASSPMFKYHPELEEVDEEKANEMHDTTHHSLSDECFNTSYEHITGSNNAQIMTTPLVEQRMTTPLFECSRATITILNSNNDDDIHVDV